MILVSRKGNRNLGSGVFAEWTEQLWGAGGGMVNQVGRWQETYLKDVGGPSTWWYPAIGRVGL